MQEFRPIRLHDLGHVININQSESENFGLLSTCLKSFAGSAEPVNSANSNFHQSDYTWPILSNQTALNVHSTMTAAIWVNWSTSCNLIGRNFCLPEQKKTMHLPLPLPWSPPLFFSLTSLSLLGVSILPCIPLVGRHLPHFYLLS